MVFLLLLYTIYTRLIVNIIVLLSPLARRNSTKSKKKRQSLYSIEFSPPVDTILDYELFNESNRNVASELSPKPMTPRHDTMTPRRVKRRSVMTRGSNSRQSTNSRRSHSSNRNSMRTSHRKFQQNPVKKLMDYQHNHTDIPMQNEGIIIHHKLISIRRN